MNEWGVVQVIIALVGLIAVVVGMVVYVVSTLTKVSEVSEHLKTEIASERELNIEAHKKIWARIDEQERTIAEHDKQIYGLKLMIDAEPD